MRNLTDSRAEPIFPVLKHPNQLLVRCDLNGLNNIRTVLLLYATGGAKDNGVAICQSVRGLDVVEDDVWRKIGLLEFPNCFPFWVHLTHQFVMFVIDQGISIVEANCRPRGGMSYLQMGWNSLSYSTTWCMRRNANK